MYHAVFAVCDEVGLDEQLCVTMFAALDAFPCSRRQTRGTGVHVHVRWDGEGVLVRRVVR